MRLLRAFLSTFTDDSAVQELKPKKQNSVNNTDEKYERDDSGLVAAGRPVNCW